MAFESSYRVSALHNPRQKKTRHFFGICSVEEIFNVPVSDIHIEGNVD